MSKYKAIKTTNDGRALLNLGCGTTMDWQWNNIDFSIYARLAQHRNAARILKKLGVLSKERFARLLNVDPNIIAWDLRKGIPFIDDSFDAVYHAHVLEHIDKDAAASFLHECRRVLKPGGIVRIVVPDLEQIVSVYSSAVSLLDMGESSAFKDHDQATHDLFDQMIRRFPRGTENQSVHVRFAERVIRGDAQKSGEAHQWMYDRHSLDRLLRFAGYREVSVESPATSRIDGWKSFCLDTNPDGTVRKRVSLYIEGVK